MQAKLDITQLIDGRPIGSFQKGTIFLCALIAFLDGMDTQSIGIAAPFIVESLGIQRSMLGMVFSAAIMGAVVGAFLVGSLADRFGRKRMLILSALLFGAGTIATSLAGSYEALLAIRFVTGIGLGGAAPCFLTLASEYAPRARRATVASMMWAAFPLGGMAGGFVNSYLIQHFGWQSMFLFGGAAPLALVVVLCFLLPESPAFLVAARRQRALAEIAARLTGAPIGKDTQFVMSEEKIQNPSFRLLFSDGRARTTLMLSVPFLMAFGTLAVLVLWTPSLLRDLGISPSDTAIVIGFHGLGALVGMASAGRMIERFGPGRVLVPALVLGAGATALVGAGSTSVASASALLALAGVFVGFGASGGIALAVTSYPPGIRSTGIGWQMGMGRVGQVLAPVLTGALLAGGVDSAGTFYVVAVAPLIAAVFVALSHRSARRGHAGVPVGT
ncbi:MFS transporter [uncultured Massilia sp.]|uniref:MFS transporter n=1 Tax=uncultured Massilia sp. TaxID=169973 RepID=UPI002583B2B7|nr:MFS transporter [uncultured Massilia sp.]